MKLALASISTPDLTPEQAVQIAVEAGYEGIEWRMSNDSFDPNAAHHFRHNNNCT